MVARNVVVRFRTTNPFRSRFDSGHRQIGDLAGSSPANKVFFFFSACSSFENMIDFLALEREQQQRCYACRVYLNSFQSAKAVDCRKPALTTTMSINLIELPVSKIQIGAIFVSTRLVERRALPHCSRHLGIPLFINVSHAASEGALANPPLVECVQTVPISHI